MKAIETQKLIKTHGGHTAATRCFIPRYGYSTTSAAWFARSAESLRTKSFVVKTWDKYLDFKMKTAIQEKFPTLATGITKYKSDTPQSVMKAKVSCDSLKADSILVSFVVDTFKALVGVYRTISYSPTIYMGRSNSNAASL